ncbi:MAG: plastocyanin/azurin family copper-binding protein [Acidimicrobiales bacterium]|nr:plastocyanin/azurin family copper-binding protein [Acidimicrobiales bacterium]
MRRLRRWALVAAAAGLGTATGYAVDASADPHGALGPGVVRVEIGIEHSRFSVGRLRVVEGTLLELVVRNDDPIAHELVVGPPSVQRAHEDGAEQRHPPVPGEVSVAPGERGFTFATFDEPGVVAYACHLPGHVAYGMAGEIEVVAAP